jgi:hypothetical protein
MYSTIQEAIFGHWFRAWPETGATVFPVARAIGPESGAKFFAADFADGRRLLQHWLMASS